MDANMIGAYGPWAAGLSGDGPARLSFRQPRFPAEAIDALARGGARAAARVLDAARDRAGPQSRSFSISSSTTGCTSST